MRLLGEARAGRLHGDGARLRIEPPARAIGAADDAHVLFELANLDRAFAGAVFFEQLGDEAVERAAVFLSGFAGAPGVRDVLVAGAPEPDVALLFGEFLPGLFEQRAFFEAELALHRFGDAAVDVALPAAEVFPRADELDAALLERFRVVGDESVGIEAEELAEAVAGEAHAAAGC